MNEELKNWRDHLGLTQDQMARYVGVSIKTWVNWERGTRQPQGAAASLFALLRMSEVMAPAIHEARLSEARMEGEE